MVVTDTVAVRSQLTKILSSPVFVNSPRMIRFLRYVVETTLEGNGRRIKEYVIALEVFDKSEAYDPHADSTVRTEASKLRARLSRYYETEGRHDPVVISIPKGGYSRPSRIAGMERRRPLPAHRPIRVKAIAAVLAVAIAVAAGMLWLSRASSSPAAQIGSADLLSRNRGAAELVARRISGGLFLEGRHLCEGSRIRGRPTDYKRSGRGLLAGLVSRRQPDRVCTPWPSLPRVAAGRRRTKSGGVGGSSGVDAGWFGYPRSAKDVRLGTSIFKVTLASGEKRRLTFPNDPTPGDLDMAISPDGRTVAFCRVLQTPGCELFVMPAGGGEGRQLTNDQRMIYGMAWTPDGREIVFASTRQNSHSIVAGPGASRAAGGRF